MRSYAPVWWEEGGQEPSPPCPPAPPGGPREPEFPCRLCGKAYKTSGEEASLRQKKRISSPPQWSTTTLTTTVFHHKVHTWHAGLCPDSCRASSSVSGCRGGEVRMVKSIVHYSITVHNVLLHYSTPEVLHHYSTPEVRWPGLAAHPCL